MRVVLPPSVAEVGLAGASVIRAGLGLAIIWIGVFESKNMDEWAGGNGHTPISFFLSRAILESTGAMLYCLVLFW